MGQSLVTRGSLLLGIQEGVGGAAPPALRAQVTHPGQGIILSADHLTTCWVCGWTFDSNFFLTLI